MSTLPPYPGIDANPIERALHTIAHRTAMLADDKIHAHPDWQQRALTQRDDAIRRALERGADVAVVSEAAGMTVAETEALAAQ